MKRRGLRLGSFRLAPPWWAILLAAIGVVILSALGLWQIERAHTKARILAAQQAARATGPQRITIDRATLDGQSGGLTYGYRYILRGRYDAAHQLLLANQVEGTKTGYRVWTPLITASGLRLMVDRGWVEKPVDPDARLPDPAAPTGPVEIQGFWRPYPEPGLRLGSRTVCDKTGWPRALNYPTGDTVACQYDTPVVNGLLLLSPEARGGFVRDWDTDRVGMGPTGHYIYASQWFLMALIAVGIVIGVNLKRDRR